MLDTLKSWAYKAFKIAIVMTPMFVAMFGLYWLGKHEIWMPETPHRDKITIAIMAAGMVLSFALQTHFSRRAKK